MIIWRNDLNYSVYGDQSIGRRKEHTKCRSKERTKWLSSIPVSYKLPVYTIQNACYGSYREK
jgi:hypothetical protein